MRQLAWTTEALDDLDSIIAYIQERNPSAALRMKALIEDAAARLPRFPMAHRKGRVEGTREAVVHPNYLLIYRVDDARVEISAVLHARQQYPPDLS